MLSMDEQDLFEDEQDFINFMAELLYLDLQEELKWMMQ
jgi:hypothetical protein